MRENTNIIITRRRTSRLSMRVAKNGDIHVSAPYGIAKKEILRFIESHREWMDKAIAASSARQQKRSAFYARLPLATVRERRDAVERLNGIVMPLVEQHSRQMGVSPSAITYRATISRWGCCNVKTKKIQFSTYLLLLPPWCIESVVVHELAHLIVPNHGERFYAVMDKEFPRWREARREIKSLV
ncbi:MAG: M48 family metallopeptidase [Bacteroidales bacterium]|nr:M48 family metallopeptidase [Bacteroidales bacterium]